MGIVSRESVSRHLPSAMLGTGIQRSGRNLVTHSFRHGYNTYARRSLPEETLRKLIGHRSERMTDRYDHATLRDYLSRLNNERELGET